MQIEKLPPLDQLALIAQLNKENKEWKTRALRAEQYVNKVKKLVGGWK